MNCKTRKGVLTCGNKVICETMEASKSGPQPERYELSNRGPCQTTHLQALNEEVSRLTTTSISPGGA